MTDRIFRNDPGTLPPAMPVPGASPIEVDFPLVGPAAPAGPLLPGYRPDRLELSRDTRAYYAAMASGDAAGLDPEIMLRLEQVHGGDPTVTRPALPVAALPVAARPVPAIAAPSQAAIAPALQVAAPTPAAQLMSRAMSGLRQFVDNQVW